MTGNRVDYIISVGRKMYPLRKFNTVFIARSFGNKKKKFKFLLISISSENFSVAIP